MFMDNSDSVPGQLGGEFSRPVESIMRCEDFKSNFARRLSNRYIPRTPVTAAKRQSSLKIRPSDREVTDNLQSPERIEPCSQLSNIRTTEQYGEFVKPPDKQLKNYNIRDTEVSALNIENETLRWQLGQTEANRQMHIALLKQVVTFLSRVKEHIECQNPEDESSKDTKSVREISSASYIVADLPRSRSVFQVNTHPEFNLSTSKKLSARKISKSISNVNGYKDCNSGWSPSKISLTPDMESARKITEEIARLITLANTVLSTKIPDLACKCSDSNNTLKDDSICNGQAFDNLKSNPTLDLIDENTSNAFILNTIYDSENAFNGVTNQLIDAKERSLANLVVTALPLTCGLENDFAGVIINDKDENKTQTESNDKLAVRTGDKRNEYNQVTNFIEDESGFSSMSSFQEIGIPIISIIPPSPCKEVGYIEELTDILDDTEKWKSDTIDLDKQTVKVFWV